VDVCMCMCVCVCAFVRAFVCVTRCIKENYYISDL